jgi:proton-coupled amino acid transporter
MTNQAQRQGKKASFVSRNFIDFLVLYGFFGGDVYPSDNEDEDDEIRSLLPATNDDENPGEGTALIRPRVSITHVKGTSPSKAFFMLSKAFVGTGVLFLPVFIYLISRYSKF